MNQLRGQRILLLFICGGVILAGPVLADSVAHGDATGKPAAGPATNLSRTAADIDALIVKAGAEPPDWWDSVPLNYPKTIDLTWSPPAGKGFDPNKSIWSYLIGVLNPNPSRHKEGCKFLAFVYDQNNGKDNAQFLAAQTLGQYYGLLLSDWARGAYWYRKAAALKPLSVIHAANLARCYARLGNENLAADVLEKAGWQPQTVRELGYMGRTDQAIKLAQGLSPKGMNSLFVGDIWRFNGMWPEALAAYNEALASGSKIAKVVSASRGGVEAMNAMQRFDLNKIADGLYSGDADGFRGNVKVQVTIKDHRITAAKVVESKDDWPLSAAVNIPAQIIEKQSVKGIDIVTGATYTSDAVIDAAAKAMGGGVK